MSDFISWCAANQSAAHSMSVHVTCRSCSNFGSRSNCIQKRNKKSLHKTSKNLSSRFQGEFPILIDLFELPIRFVYSSFRPDVKQNFGSFKRLQMFYKSSIKYQIRKRNIMNKKLIQMKFWTNSTKKEVFTVKEYLRKNIILPLTKWNKV